MISGMARHPQLDPAVASWSAGGVTAEPACLGGKATGLLELPTDWTPAFVVLTASFAQLWRTTGSAEVVFGTQDRATRLLEELITRCQGSPWCDGVIARSNTPAEAFGDRRGAYTSVPTDGTREHVCAAIDTVLAQHDLDGHGLFALLQLHVRREGGGHLSNERRVTPRRTVWLAEHLDPDGARIAPASFIDSRLASNDSLTAQRRSDIPQCLRTIAKALTGTTSRFLCEWVWDGAQVWVVQRDEVAEIQNPAVARYLRRRATGRPPSTGGSLRWIQRVDAVRAEGWSKRRRPTVLDALGMPTASVLLLTGSDFLASSQAGHSELLVDLRELLSDGTPLVVRCDVRHGGLASELSLPTSDPVFDPADALAFMQQRSSAFVQQAQPLSDWAFLPAHLVPTRVSVMAHARPGAQRVRLDALWGFPDGIGLLPHDTWFHDIASDRLIERRQHKGTCLFFERAAGWQFAEVPPPFDWGRLLRDDEAQTASSWARRLADHLQKEIQLMVLARIDGQRGADAMIAWHYTDHVVPTRGASTRVVPIRGVPRVSCPDDLDVIGFGEVAGIHLRPVVTARRDPLFLTAVGTRAAEAGIPVYFEGSVLGHPYYLLRSAGATVVPVGADEPEPPSYEFNKLVRDGIPDIARLGGSSIKVVHASPAQAEWLLRHKLVEEALEVWESDEHSLIDELADLYEVLRGFHMHTPASAAVVEAARQAKRATRGGFDSLAYLERTESESVPTRRDATSGRSLLESVRVERAPASHGTRSPVQIDRPDRRTVVMRVPLAPPLRDGVPLREYGARIDDARVTFSYRGLALEIRIQEIEAQRGPGQLSLPIE
jgi:predicted house-cleaning noncanonical NTP pyrophosphatase (MazG superfamily)